MVFEFLILFQLRNSLKKFKLHFFHKHNILLGAQPRNTFSQDGIKFRKEFS